MDNKIMLEINRAVQSFDNLEAEFIVLMSSALKTSLGYRHKWYDRTVEKAIFYKSMATGENQDSYITSYKDKELEAQKANRIKITRTKTKSVTQKILAQFERIYSQPRILDSFTYTSGSDQTESRDNQVKEQKLLDLTSNFVGSKSIDLYLREYFIYTNLIDPNAFLLVANSQNQQGETVANPSIIYSKNVWDYEYSRGVLDYLTTGYNYSDYCEVIAYGKKYQISITTYKDTDKVITLKENQTKFGIDGKILVVTYIVFDKNALQVPAIRLGTDKDQYTKLETTVGIIDPTEFEYRDLINRKSEYDLSLQLHLFLQKVQKGEPCKYIAGNNEMCRDGYLSISGSSCPSCKGSGLQTLATSQDALIIRPTDEDTGTPLSVNDYVKYVELPFDIVTHQHDIIAELPSNISECIFGVDVTKIGESMNPTTATEIDSKVDTMNGVLSRYAEKMATVKRFIISQLAINFGINAGLAISIEAPKDFKILSVQVLAQQMKLLKEAGAPSDIIDNIENQIRERQNQDNQFKNAVAKVRERFEPFKSISEPLKSSYIISLPDNNLDKILYLNQDRIYSDLKIDNPELFTTASKKLQREVIFNKVQEIANSLVQNAGLSTFVNEENTEDV